MKAAKKKLVSRPGRNTGAATKADENAQKSSRSKAARTPLALKAKKDTSGKKVQRQSKARTTRSGGKSPSAKSAASSDSNKLTFNHAMLYVKDVARAMEFYRNLLGFQLVEDFRHQGIPVYARLRAPGGDGTIALHLAGPGVSVASEGMRLYFEVRELDDFCHKLQKRGFYFTELPRLMPWGWRHAYLNDPDGHEISLYWAGENRMKKTMMEAAKQVSKA